MIRQRLIESSRRRSLMVAALAALLAVPAVGVGAEEGESISNAPPPVPAMRPMSMAAPGPNRAAPAAPGKPLPPSTFNLPPAFAILSKRTLFSKGGTPAAATVAGGSPEATMAVRGIVSDETSFLVFIEDTTSHRTVRVRPGETVAGGKVGKICLDDFTFESGGASRRICVGQNLLGAPVPPAMPAPPQPPGGPEGGPKPEGPPSKNPKGKEPVFEIGPNGQRVRNIVAERAG